MRDMGDKYELRQETQLANQRPSCSCLNSPKAYKQVQTIKPQSEAMTTKTTESQPHTALYIYQSISPAQQQWSHQHSSMKCRSGKYIAGSRTYPGPQPYKLGCSRSQFHHAPSRCQC